MSRQRGGWRQWLVAACGLLAAGALILAAATPAEAARKRKRAPAYSPPYAAMVVDAKTGRTLHAVNEDALRHPASITKVMTLYMLFEQMERGRFRMDTPLRVSAYAASRPPSKIGVAAGETIEVEDAIKALITKSANDVAVVVAENIAGDEETFADQMTRRARQLGMSRTVFRNASGLPDPKQVTTARDLTILARAIQERFPRHFHMFQTRTFTYEGRSYRNHNKLLGRVQGVDGIKTGYTRASGFNLMTSAKADGRHIVSIVLGGRSGRHRDGIMANLVVAHLPRASTGPQRVMVAQAANDDREDARTPARTTERPADRTPERAAERPAVTLAVTTPARSAAPQPAPEPVRVAAIHPAANVALAPQPQPRPIELAAIRPVPAGTVAQAFAPPTPTSASQQAMRWAVGQPAVGAREVRPAAAGTGVPRPPASIGQPQPAQAAAPATAAAPPRQPVTPAPVNPAPVATAAPRQPVPPSPTGLRPPANIEFTSSVPKTTAAERTPAPAETARQSERAQPRIETVPAAREGREGWMIQLGATDDEGKARSLLDNARARSRAVADARPFTETVERGGTRLWRARFAGFDDQAEADRACRELKRSGFSCFATRT